jgi:hypothetical protein
VVCVVPAGGGVVRKPVAVEQSSLFADEPASNSKADLGWNEQSTRAPLRFPIPPGTPASTCRSCAAKVFWIVTSLRRKMPVDHDGTSHFATCPNAAQHRSTR